MSNGKLCGHKIKISHEINGENKTEVSCDLYEGHEGDHSKMFYHCVERPNEIVFKSNYRLGIIQWKNEYEQEE